ncbi:UDP-GlcNAc:betaGal beta-1,3-N-acetylglucosaminyltransferase 7 [Hydra vulgaris]|uniref:Hexosyltransferase n=1 Tax=Hydra vulgaris TaxID=6087 RepID=A0ABM4BL25_HYDVU
MSRSKWFGVRKRYWLTVFLLFVLIILIRLLTIQMMFICVFDYEKVFLSPNENHFAGKKHITKLSSSFNCSKEHLKLLVLVTSNISNFDRRETIRRTWGKPINKHFNNDFRTFFMLSKSPDKEIMKTMEEESAKHGDIIICDFFEDFYQLSFKVEAAFEWAHIYCSYEYLLKSDDDVYVNLFNLFELLVNKDTPKKNLYLGYHHQQPRVSRSGKYKVELHEYGSNCYPDYCAGGAVVLSSDLIEKILLYFQPVPLKIDDAYIGILVKNAGAKPTHNEGFRFFAESCSFEEFTIAHHPAKTRVCMEKIHYGMLEKNNENEFVRKHYIENNSLK